MILWGHETNKKQCFHLQKMHGHQETPKYVPLIKWPIRGHVTVWKIYVSTFVMFTINKLGRLQILGTIFSTQTLKSSLTSCLYIWWPCCCQNIQGRYILQINYIISVNNSIFYTIKGKTSILKPVLMVKTYVENAERWIYNFCKLELSMDQALLE